MNKFSIVFCGTPSFAVPSLEALAADPTFDVRLVVTQPDRPIGRSKVLTPPPVKEAALRLALPVFQPENINEITENCKLKTENCDFLITVAYGRILSPAILALPRIAPVNVHGSLLPRWRGASPVEHAILSGDAETGVTIQIMEEELDAGPILAQKSLAVSPRATTPELKEQLCRLGAELLVATLKAPLHPISQPIEGVTFCAKLTREDGRVDPATRPAKEIDRRVRALNPWPGVTVTIEGQTLKLLATSLEPQNDSFPLPCAQGTTLHLVTVQPAGRKAMTGAEWSRGRQRNA